MKSSIELRDCEIDCSRSGFAGIVAQGNRACLAAAQPRADRIDEVVSTLKPVFTRAPTGGVGARTGISFLGIRKSWNLNTEGGEFVSSG